MYGDIVGKTTKPISLGQALTTSNVQHQASDFHEQSGTYSGKSPMFPAGKTAPSSATNGRMARSAPGTYWLVVPLVFCENRNIGVLKQAFEEELGFAAPQVYRRQVAELASFIVKASWKAPGSPAFRERQRTRNARAV